MGPPVVTASLEADRSRTASPTTTYAASATSPRPTRPADGARVVTRLRELGWRPQAGEDGFGTGQPQYTFEVPLTGDDGARSTEDDVLRG